MSTTGPRKWVKFAAYRVLQSELADAQGRVAAERKREHGDLANLLMAGARNWQTEDVSCLAFQKTFGRGVGKRAPSLFIATLARKDANAGGSLVAFRTHATRLSQFDHTTPGYVKKPLSQRIHVFGDGRTAPVDRDVYSAFLARFVREYQIDIRQATLAWPRAEPLAGTAVPTQRELTLSARIHRL